jgi:hypothetical protein
MTTENPPTSAHCPFCSALMEGDSPTWTCNDHGSFTKCPSCANPLVGKIDLWCAECRKWLNGKKEEEE